MHMHACIVDATTSLDALEHRHGSLANIHWPTYSLDRHERAPLQVDISVRCQGVGPNDVLLSFGWDKLSGFQQHLLAVARFCI